MNVANKTVLMSSINLMSILMGIANINYETRKYANQLQKDFNVTSMDSYW